MNQYTITQIYKDFHCNSRHEKEKIKKLIEKIIQEAPYPHLLREIQRQFNYKGDFYNQTYYTDNMITVLKRQYEPSQPELPLDI